jgi:hypothetical protein
MKDESPCLPFLRTWVEPHFTNFRDLHKVDEPKTMWRA